MKIEWKNIIVAAVLVLLFVLGGLYKFGVFDGMINSSSSNSTTTTTTSNPSTSGTTTLTLRDVDTVDNSSSVGIIAPPPPTGGKIRSVSMVGPSGCYSDVTRTDGKNYKVIKTAFTPMLINEQAGVTAADIKNCLQGYIKLGWDNGVSDKGDIQIVVASSLVGNSKIKEILPELKKSYTVTETTSAQEGLGDFRVAIAPQYYDTATAVDITPTIIRNTYSVRGKVSTEVAQTGSKYYQQNQTKEQALSIIRESISKIPSANREQCIVLWAAAAKDLRKGYDRYSDVPTYNGTERFITEGLELIEEVKKGCKKTVIDYDGHWYSTF